MIKRSKDERSKRSKDKKKLRSQEVYKMFRRKSLTVSVTNHSGTCRSHGAVCAVVSPSWLCVEWKTPGLWTRI